MTLNVTQNYIDLTVLLIVKIPERFMWAKRAKNLGAAILSSTLTTTLAMMIMTVMIMMVVVVAVMMMTMMKKIVMAIG